MKKSFLIFCVLTLLLTGTGAQRTRLVRLTLVNKSGMDIEVSLNGKEYEQFYYLKVPQGNPRVASEKMFTIVPDTYSVDAYFVELWDPVYGASCQDRQSTVDITHNTKIIILACDRTPANGGEAPLIKLGGHNARQAGPRGGAQPQ